MKGMLYIGQKIYRISKFYFYQWHKLKKGTVLQSCSLRRIKGEMNISLYVRSFALCAARAGRRGHRAARVWNGHRAARGPSVHINACQDGAAQHRSIKEFPFLDTPFSFILYAHKLVNRDLENDTKKFQFIC